MEVADGLLEEQVIAGVRVYDCGAGTDRHRRFVAVHARNRPPASMSVHLLEVVRHADGEAGPATWVLCGGPEPGVVRRDGLGPGEHFCAACLRRLASQQWVPPAPDLAPPAGLDPLKDWRAHILIRARGPAEVTVNGFSELLNSLIREIPGRRWDKAARVWRIPPVFARDLEASLAGAGVDVRVTAEPPPETCPHCGSALG